jgi:hypothetical protein
LAAVLIGAVALLGWPASAHLPSAPAARPATLDQSGPVRPPSFNRRVLNPATAGRPLTSGQTTAPGPQAPPAFGTDVRISTDNPGRPHNEHFGAADPLDPLHFLTGANDYGTTSGSGAWRTTDGGLTWTGGNLTGPYPGGSGIEPGGDPAGDIDALTPQNTYFADLGYNPGSLCTGGAYVHRSTDGGATWGAAVQVAASNATTFVDKEWLAVNKQTTGPFAGRVYVTYTDFPGSGCLTGITAAIVRLKHSTDQGATWSAAVTLPQPTPFDSSGTDVIVANDGTVYVAYNYWTDPANNDQVDAITRSTDGGATFSAFHASTSTPLTFTGYLAPDGQYYKADNAGHGFRHNQNPSIGVSPTNSNIVYMVWNHHQAGWDTSYQAACCGGSATMHMFLAGDIAFARSTDGGTTWSAAQRINDDALNNARDQFFPWLTVGPDGTIHVMWMDRRDDPNNNLYHIYYSQSTDGGVTWSANVRVSDQPSDPAHVLFVGNNGFIGDYNGIAASALRVLPFWCDARAGTPANEQRLYTDPGIIAGGGTATATASPVAATVTETPVTTETATPTATGTPTVCTLTFNDVPVGSTFYPWIRCLTCRGIVSGYPCGGPGEPCPGQYYRPNNNVTRGQVSKIVSESAQFADPVPSTQQTFEDVPPGSTFWVWIERLSVRGIIQGYPCGGPFEPCVAPNNRPYFRPGNNVTRGQISKIVAGAAGYTETPTTQTFEDVPPGSTFYLYIERIAVRGIIQGYPCGGPFEPCVAPNNRPYFRPNYNATRGQMAKIAAEVFFPNCQTPASRR